MTRTEAKEVLGIEGTYTPEQVKQAYRRKASIAHPDTPTGDAWYFRRLGEARDLLMTPETTSKGVPHARESTSQGASQAGSRDPAERLHPVVRDVLEAIASEEAEEGLERLIGDRAPAAQAAVRVFLGVLSGTKPKKKRKTKKRKKTK